ncbi:MAG: S8 family serine peptidase, partial [Candidatus Thermoplasmatota archaeon]
MEARKRMVGTVLVITLALCMGVPLGIADVRISDIQNSTSTSYMLIDAQDEAQRGLLLDLGVNPIVAYEDFVLAEITDAQRTALEREGIAVGEMEDRTMIGMDSYTFHTREGEPLLPEGLRIGSYGLADGLYIVQFIGPVKQEWLSAIESAGAEIYSYLPNYAYIVRMSPNTNAGVSALDFVQWIGIYQPGYKIDPQVTGGKITVMVWNGPTAGNTIEALGSSATVIQTGYDSGFDQYHLTVLADANVIDDIARLPDVIWIEPYDEPALMDETGSEIVGGIWVADTPYGGPGNYANLLGWDGTNVIVSVADTGIGDGTTGDAGHLDFETRVVGGTQYGTLTNWVDGHAHGTHVSGIVAGDGFQGTGIQYPGTTYYVGLGVAPDAKLFAQRIFDAAGSFQGPASWDTFFQDAYNAGAYVHQNSWGESTGDSAYETYDIEYDQAARDSATSTSGDQPMVICVAAGNSGSGAGTIGSPASGKDVISVGASENYHPDAATYGETGGYSADNIDQQPTFSSRGLEDDLRIKPDVVAPGTCVLSARSPSGGSTLHGVYNQDTRYLWCSGTSQACPHGSGSAAVVVEWYNAQYGVRPMPAMVKALIINTATDMGTADIPNGNEGWGRIYLPTVVDPPVSMLKKDNPQLLQTGNVWSTQVSYASSAQPMKFTLVWTDPAAAALANPTLINNLNL